MKSFVSFSLACVAVLAGCAAGNAATAPCGAERTMLDGVCVTQPVADYVACVRAQGARLGEDRSKKLSAEAGFAGTRAAVAADVSDKLQREYSTSDANVLEVIRACGAMRTASEDVCARAGSTLVACGFDNEPGWLAECQKSPSYKSCLASQGSDCAALATCGFAEVSRTSCGGAATATGTATCEATGACTQKCGYDVACKCACFTAMSKDAVLPVGIVGQCFNLHCAAASAGGAASAGANACFAQHCSATYQRVCQGH